jgi:putative oxidoreductase
MENVLQTYVPPVARLLLAFIFLSSGFNKIVNFSGVTGYMAANGITVATGFFLFGAIVFLLVGGTSLILGFKARLGAALLIAFLIPTTLIFHAFWAVPEAQAQQEMISFMKNVSILGGLLMVLAQGAGGFSLDARLRKA